VCMFMYTANARSTFSQHPSEVADQGTENQLVLYEGAVRTVDDLREDVLRDTKYVDAYEALAFVWTRRRTTPSPNTFGQAGAGAHEDGDVDVAARQ
jgi:hypothetical protein